MRSLKLFFWVFIFLFSCNEEGDPTLLLISPPNLTHSINAGDVIGFNINCTSDYSLKNFSISLKEEQSFTEVVLDSPITSSYFSMSYEYKAPEFPEVLTKIYITFTLTDEFYNITQAIKILEVHSQRKLTESAGHELFSHLSGNYDAYNLISGKPLHSELTVSDSIHIMDVSTDSISGTNLLRKWESPAGIKFVRFNDFDYANATISTLKQSFDAGIKNDYIDNLNDGDIILTRINNNQNDSYLALKIINIIDNDSTLTDRYIFNIKK